MLQIIIILVEEWFSAKLICWKYSLTDFHTPGIEAIWGMRIRSVSSNNGITQTSQGPLELWGAQQGDQRIFRVTAIREREIGHLCKLKVQKRNIWYLNMFLKNE